MIVKYIPASLLTALRIVGTFTPRCSDLMSRVCMTTNAKAMVSEETGG